MSARKLIASAMVAAFILTLFGCGVGTGRRFITRPDDYNKMMGFQFAAGEPVTVEKITTMYPELKGIVMTAPQYIEEYELELAKAAAEGRQVVQWTMQAGTSFEVNILGETGYPKTFTVPPDGYVVMPLVGDVTVINKTKAEVRKDIETRLAKYIKEPQVIINITGASNIINTPYGVDTFSGISGGDIIVMGLSQTRFTTNVQYTGRETLVSILGRTGLPGNAEWRQIRVIRRSQQNPLKKSRIILCDLWNFFQLGDVRQDIPLMPGDVVYVPQLWSAGQQFEHDWNLILQYMSGSLSMRNFTNVLKTDIKEGDTDH